MTGSAGQAKRTAPRIVALSVCVASSLLIAIAGCAPTRVGAEEVAAPMLLQVSCFNAADFQAIAEGEFIMFVNALINSVTSDFLRGAIGS